MKNNSILKIIYFNFLFSICSISFTNENRSLVLWEEYIDLRDNVYNNTSCATMLLEKYQIARDTAYEKYSENNLLVALSRCEYIMGRAFLFENDNENAEKHFIAGANYAKQAMENNDSGMGTLMYAENISQNCLVQPFSYVLKYGPKIKGLAKKASQLKPISGAALFLMNAQLIYAPSPFCNFNKGVQELEIILEKEDIILEKDDLFNIYIALGLGYIELNNNSTASFYFNSAQELYPGNVYLKKLIEEKTHKL